MTNVYGSRDIIRNPSLLRIDENDSFIVEDKKAHKTLGIYLGTKLAEEFFNYVRKQELLKSAQKIKNSANEEFDKLEGTLNDGI
ncbi:hypothetical protein [Aliarcobacter butzleri]|uniref:hypothetical protein n=1 Tax=Aliarcobacter butzleri TaxID=28197 RepID=UPI0018A0641E|nr:hypothetical protein [Aliarcobacter butzleri]MBF7066333.1 hypothetical protein [Aliarcobacter butzleri]